MIDWLSMVVPLRHPAPIHGDRLLCVSPDGDVSWSVAKRTTVPGSFSTGLQLRTAMHTADPCTHLEISGNPVKFFQGHNLWGTDDLPSLAIATVQAVADSLGLEISHDDRALIERGEIQITRVDCTESFHLRNLGEVLSWLRAAEQTAHLSHRGRGQLCKGSTLYFGKNSRRWSLKLYAKGQEIKAKGHGQDAVLELPSAVEWADKTLRAELTLRSMELKRLNLASVHDWFPVEGVPFPVTRELLRERLGNMTMTTITRLSAEIMDSLRPALRVAVQAWEGGSDLRATLSRPTFYRYRKELLPHGIDIATLHPREVSNVVPLHRVLEAVPAPIPDWAIGTKLYFEPRRVA